MGEQTTIQKSWKLSEWCGQFSVEELPPMTKEEIQASIKFLKDNNYPKPEDCPQQKCPEYRPACQLGICKIAVVMAGDW